MVIVIVHKSIVYSLKKSKIIVWVVKQVRIKQSSKKKHNIVLNCILLALLISIFGGQ